MKKILLISLFASSALLASSYYCDAHQQDAECSTETVTLIADQSTVNEIVMNPARMSLANNNKKAR